MFASLIRIALLAGLVFGGYKFYPRFKPALEPILANPKILGVETIEPVINKVNGILPDKLQIPTPKSENSTANPNPSPSSTVIKDIVDEVKQKASEAAQGQIDTAKKEATNAFCAALVESIKKQCGVQ